jgi:hypothetical protein
MQPLEPSPNPPTPTPTTATVRSPKVIVAELACLVCARSIGSATADCWPPRGPVLFKPADSTNARWLATWWRLRCHTCGGNTAATELVVRAIRLDAPSDWQADRPRRGRPPAWLAAQRRAIREAAGD